MCFFPARKGAFRHSSPILVLTYPVEKLADGHMLVIVIFYSCGGFNTPTPLEASLRGCVGGVDYAVSIRVPYCLGGHTLY